MNHVSRSRSAEITALERRARTAEGRVQDLEAHILELEQKLAAAYEGQPLRTEKPPKAEDHEELAKPAKRTSDPGAVEDTLDDTKLIAEELAPAKDALVSASELLSSTDLAPVVRSALSAVAGALENVPLVGSIARLASSILTTTAEATEAKSACRWVNSLHKRP